MKLGEILARGAYGGVKGWLSAQQQENAREAEMEQEKRKQELLARKEEAKRRAEEAKQEQARLQQEEEYKRKKADKEEEYNRKREDEKEDYLWKKEQEKEEPTDNWGTYDKVFQEALKRGYSEDEAKGIAAKQSGIELPEKKEKKPAFTEKDIYNEKKKLEEAFYEFKNSMTESPEEQAKYNTIEKFAQKYSPSAYKLIFGDEEMPEEETGPDYSNTDSGEGLFNLADVEETAMIVKSDFEDGVSLSKIKKSLASSGWSAKNINNVLRAAGITEEKKKEKTAKETPSPKKPGQKMTPEIAKLYKEKYGTNAKAAEAAIKDGWSIK